MATEDDVSVVEHGAKLNAGRGVIALIKTCQIQFNPIPQINWFTFLTCELKTPILSINWNASDCRTHWIYYVCRG